MRQGASFVELRAARKDRSLIRSSDHQEDRSITPWQRLGILRGLVVRDPGDFEGLLAGK